MNRLFVTSLALVCVYVAAPLVQADQAPADIVEFHIPADTGSKPWNTLEKPIMVKRGQTLRFINDDSIEHFLHTNGSPCPHGRNAFGPGESYDCVITKVHNANAGDNYDHEQGPDAKVYIQAD
jgi:hypothetical protein